MSKNIQVIRDPLEDRKAAYRGVAPRIELLPPTIGRRMTVTPVADVCPLLGERVERYIEHPAHAAEGLLGAAVARAELFHIETGRVLRTGEVIGFYNDGKAMAELATAALQRAIATAGFRGDDFTDDELDALAAVLGIAPDSGVVALPQDDGSSKPYQRFAKRVKAFHADHPLSEGWAIITRSAPLSSIDAKGAERYFKRLDAHADTNDSLLDFGPWLFEAELQNGRGAMVHSNITLEPTAGSEKAFRCGETAAIQRVIALAGYGSELFDRDEQADQARMGVSRVGAPAAPPPAANPAPVSAGSATTSASVVTVDSSSGVTPAPKAKMAVRQGGVKVRGGQSVLTMLKAQIAKTAKRKGQEVDVDSITTEDDARATLAKLLKPVKDESKDGVKASKKASKAS